MKHIGEIEMQEIANKIMPMVEGYGFALIVFELGNRQGKGGNYISNGTRETMIAALDETVQRLKNKQDFKTPNIN